MSKNFAASITCACLVSICVFAWASAAAAQENVSSWSGPTDGELMIFRTGDTGYMGEQKFEIGFSGPEITLKLHNGDAMQTVKREGAGIGSSVISGKNGSQCFMMAYEDDTGREKLIVVGTGEFIDYLTKEAQLQNKPAKASGPGDARFAFIEFLARDWEQMKFE